MDSELQAALADWESLGTIRQQELGWMHPLVETARKYANPDYEAATAITNQLRYAKTSDDWDDLIYDITKEAVDAALGVTEDTHEA